MITVVSKYENDQQLDRIKLKYLVTKNMKNLNVFRINSKKKFILFLLSKHYIYFLILIITGTVPIYLTCICKKCAYQKVFSKGTVS